LKNAVDTEAKTSAALGFQLGVHRLGLQRRHTAWGELKDSVMLKQLFEGFLGEPVPRDGVFRNTKFGVSLRPPVNVVLYHRGGSDPVHHRSEPCRNLSGFSSWLVASFASSLVLHTANMSCRRSRQQCVSHVRRPAQRIAKHPFDTFSHNSIPIIRYWGRNNRDSTSYHDRAIIHDSNHYDDCFFDSSPHYDFCNSTIYVHYYNLC